MRFLKDKRRAGAIGLLTALLGATALLIGAGSASAHHCDTMPSEPGNFTVGVPGVVEAGMDQDDIGTDHWGIYACTWNAATGHGIVGVHLDNKATADPGTQVAVAVCEENTCPVVLDWTGVEVGVPSSPSPNEPGGGNGTGGTVSGGSACTWADGVPFCPVPPTPTDVTVAEDDLVPIVETAPSCVYLDGDCLVPTVSGARVTLFPDTANDTLVIATPPDYDRTDVDRTCIGVNYACP